MPGIIVVGAQWGDEGKGKIIDLLSEKAHTVVRAQGGNNAGHTIVNQDKEYKFHLIPSGILYDHVHCYIGGGTVIDPEVLLKEMDDLKHAGIDFEARLKISSSAHVIFSYHKLIDELAEKAKGPLAIGTTKRGIGPAYSDKVNRIGICMAELVDEKILKNKLKEVLNIKNFELQALYQQKPLDFESLYNHYLLLGKKIKPFVEPFQNKLHEALKQNHIVLFEGAQGTFLDVGFGTYPYVTSSQTIASGIAAGAGIGPSKINHTIGVVKAYTTRVGNGPFPTEMNESEIVDFEHEKAREIGTTTGRKRRLGWFDVPMIKQAVSLNGLDSIALTKLDVLDHLKEIKVCIGYELGGEIIDYYPPLENELITIKPVYKIFKGWQTSTKEVKNIKDLPKEAYEYVKALEKFVSTKISILSIGPSRQETLILDDYFR
jgi:adenylosuccinate synthase